MRIWNTLKLVWQVFGRTQALSDPESARAWFQNVTSTIRPYVSDTKTLIDDKLLDCFDKILQSPELFAYAYELVCGWIHGVDSDENTVAVSAGKPTVWQEPSFLAIRDKCAPGTNPTTIFIFLVQLLAIIRQMSEAVLDVKGIEVEVPDENNA